MSLTLFAVISVLLFILGTAIGSFLNVVIYRSVKNESWVSGRSKCDYCERQLAWWENVPLFSYLMLGGKCRTCHKTLSISHPVVEFLTGSLFLWWWWGGSLFFRLTTQPFTYIQPMFWLVVGMLLVIIFFADLMYMIIPDEAVFLLMGLTFVYRIALVLSQIMRVEDFVKTLIATVLCTAFFFSLWYFTKGKGMGFGDVKYSVPFALLLGWPNVLVGVFLAFVLGGLVSAFLLISHKKKMKQAVPFGPFLVLSTVMSLIWGTQIWEWYLSFLR